MLIYGICYYYGVNKIQNILNHVKCFNNIKKADDIFCLNVMVDSFDKDAWIKIENTFHDLLKSYEVKNFKVLIDYNSGGTVLGLYNTFNCFKNNDYDNNKNVYIAFFEEDFYPINNNWLNDSLELLNSHSYIYIGEHQPPSRSVITKKYEFFKKKYVYDMDKSNCWNLSFSKILSNQKCLLSNDNELCWTDGGFYFSSIGNLRKIQDKIGIFHKGNKNTKYNHEIDGIILGEVGFPSQIYKYYNFTGLLRNKYFMHR